MAGRLEAQGRRRHRGGERDRPRHGGFVRQGRRAGDRRRHPGRQGCPHRGRAQRARTLRALRRVTRGRDRGSRNGRQEIFRAAGLPVQQCRHRRRARSGGWRHRRRFRFRHASACACGTLRHEIRRAADESEWRHGSIYISTASVAGLQSGYGPILYSIAKAAIDSHDEGDGGAPARGIQNPRELHLPRPDRDQYFRAGTRHAEPTGGNARVDAIAEAAKDSNRCEVAAARAISPKACCSSPATDRIG